MSPSISPLWSSQECIGRYIAATWYRYTIERLRMLDFQLQTALLSPSSSLRAVSSPHHFSPISIHHTSLAVLVKTELAWRSGVVLACFGFMLEVAASILVSMLSSILFANAESLAVPFSTVSLAQTRSSLSCTLFLFLAFPVTKTHYDSYCCLVSREDFSGFDDMRNSLFYMSSARIAKQFCTAAPRRLLLY